jgi:hypothetical protein
MSAALQKQFRRFINGERKVHRRLDGQHFLQASCLQPNPSAAVEQIVSTREGLDAVRGAVRCDLTEGFVENYVVPFLLFISNPSVKALFDGSFLRKVVEAIVEPPTFWAAFLTHFEDKRLADNGTQALAWLVLELLTQLPPISDAVVQHVRFKLGSAPFVGSSQENTRIYGYQIQKVLQLLESGHPDVADGPGGRHDNDFADFRRVSVYPTRDELNSVQKPFYLATDEVFETSIEKRTGVHLENQFRLLREDMLWELRDDVQLSTGQRKGGKRRPLMLGDLLVHRLGACRFANPRGRLSLLLSVGIGLKMVPPSKPDINKDTIKPNAFGVFLVGKDVVAFGFVKTTGGLESGHPTVEVELTDVKFLKAVLEVAISPGIQLRFSAVDTPVFAYEPVLQRLKEMTVLPLEGPLMSAEPSDLKLSPQMQQVVSELERKLTTGSYDLDNSPLDKNQLLALLYALKTSVSVIQGPPGKCQTPFSYTSQMRGVSHLLQGTGKSYIGALFVKAVLKAGKRVLLLTYTNHSLDDFLSHLLKIGIAQESMVRLGSKASEKTTSMSLENQRMRCRRSYAVRSKIESLKATTSDIMEDLTAAGKAYMSRLGDQDILEYLEFNEPDFYEALSVPAVDDGGFQRVGGKGEKINADYLIKRWRNGAGPGALPEVLESEGARLVWSLSPEDREGKRQGWVCGVKKCQFETIVELSARFQHAKTDLESLLSDRDRHTLLEKSLTACTTTAAAKYQDLIKASNPEIVIVEEAGEILEAHVLAALCPTVEQLVLIGDHKQLRPKINNYALSVESGEGYDLNRSLFERLILASYPYKILTTQHRMHPDIARLPRALTYPELQDGARTLQRPPPRGIRGRVVFVNHESREDELAGVSDRRDAGSKSSKQNMAEALMVLRIVKYLAQQGYKTENLVVLTPYLGQLRLLRDKLRASFDPVLNDLDAFELKRAGLLTGAASKLDGGRLRISTVGKRGPAKNIVPLMADFSRQLPGRGERHRHRVSDQEQCQGRHRVPLVPREGQRSDHSGERCGHRHWQRGDLHSQPKREGAMDQIFQPSEGD